jgi:hypothetical protein
MATRDILDYLGNVIGVLEAPDGTPEEVWAEMLAPYAATPAEQQVQTVVRSLLERTNYCRELIERIKANNVIDGINAAQGLWMHHRMRAMPVTIDGLALTLDIINIAYSGDIELGCIALQYVTPDDMTQPYHWLTQARIDWIVDDMKSFLGWP